MRISTRTGSPFSAPGCQGWVISVAEGEVAVVVTEGLVPLDADGVVGDEEVDGHI